jgi:hypothetical protein
MLVTEIGRNMRHSFSPVVIAVRVLAVLTAIGITQFAPAQSCDDPSSHNGDRVENAPFSAQRRVISITRNADSISTRDEATQSEARDGKGRVYIAGERHWDIVVGNERVDRSEFLVRIFDPVAHTSTTWSSSSKKVKVVHWQQEANEPNAPNPFLSFASPNSNVEKLGTKIIGGISADGMRTSYTATATETKGDKSFADFHECWYSPELRVVLLETRNSPTLSFRSELEQIVRGEPDVAKYQPPATYDRSEVGGSERPTP